MGGVVTLIVGTVGVLGAVILVAVQSTFVPSFSSSFRAFGKGTIRFAARQVRVVRGLLRVLGLLERAVRVTVGKV
jgi:hypothetical protein